MGRFKDKNAERVFRGLPVRRLPSVIRRRARMRVQRVIAAEKLSDLRLPTSHHLKVLIGGPKGTYSIRINDQWRVCFRWTAQGAVDIEIIDYH